MKRQARFIRQIPEGDDKERMVCGDCGFVNYQNPKVVVGSVVTSDERFLLCKRAIEPRRGFWTLPAGYLELGESTEDGARREAYEEARASIEIDRLLAVYSIVHISQVQLIYRATLGPGGFSAGPETEEVALFRWEELPWEELAFPSVAWSLRYHREVEGQASFPPFGNPDDDDGIDPVANEV
ncbi:MAG: NUDIX hydrolase [Myxococcota bacterium]